MPNFGGASIDPVVFVRSPGSTCHPQPSNSEALPTATGTGAISYAIANLPDGITVNATTGVLTSDLETITAQAARTYTYIATDAADNRTASLRFTIEVVDEKAILEAFYTATNGDTWTNQTDTDPANDWPNKGADPYTIPPTTCLEDLEGVNLHRFDHLGGTVGRVGSLTLSNNNLTGRLPTELGKLTNLTELSLHENSLTGSIPATLGNLTSLYVLEINSNSLTGKIPRELGNLTSLERLRLNNNQLSGSIPTTIGQLTNLTELWLYNNDLSGSIPATIGNLTNLPQLSLRNNNLSGSIPATIGNLTNLTDLELDNNNLSSSIPTTIGNLTSLGDLELYNNNLSGSIPTTIGNLTSLTFLRLDNNKLSGRIPPEIGDMTGLTQLRLQGNQLSGPIPQELGNLTSLLVLFLHNNKLNGQIPNEIAALTRLIYLYLHGNKLSGEVPTQIAALTRLRYLSLYSNAGLYNYPGDLATKSSLALLSPGDGTAVCLPTAQGGTDCTIPTKVDQLRLRPSYDRIEATWQPHPTGSTPSYELEYRLRSWTSVPLSPATATTATIRDLTPGQTYDVRVRTTANPATPWLWSSVTLPPLSDYPDTVSLTASTRRPAEGATVRVTATLSTPAPAGGVTVQFSAYPTGDHPAYYGGRPHVDSGHDYVLSPVGDFGTTPQIEIPEGARQATATLRVWDDAEPEGNETFGVTVSVSWPLADHPELVFTIPANDGGGNGGGNGGGGGGGGGTRTPSDQHGDTPDEATTLNPRRYTTGVIQRTLDAHLQSRRDVDYFTLTLPYGGLLTAATTGGVDTTGRLYQAQADGDPRLVAEDTDSGRGSNFALGTAVTADTYYLAVSAGRGSGEYTLTVHYTPAFVDNPGPASPQSGVSVLSGWVCDAATVEIEFETPGGASQTWVPATGTSRPDTAVACGPTTTDTGYGLLFNWNRLGDGEHTVRVVIDDVVLAERQITVTTLGEHPDQEFRRDLAATTEVADFPAVGETTTLQWQTARQNFVIARGAGGGGGAQLTPAQAWLGIPPPGSFQSGIGVLSGWVCEAGTVELVFETATGATFTEEAGYGTERLDTAGVCGDTDNGFGLLFNWNRLGDGQHTVRAYADDVEFAHSTFNVTTLGEEFAENLTRTHAIEDFPAEGQTTTVEWQQGQQNFVITGVE